jgi:hypothetical protein
MYCLFIYLFVIACFRLLSLGANVFGNLQELDFQDYEKLPVGEQDKWQVTLDHFVPLCFPSLVYTSRLH